jgi:hypothetical protein
MLGAAGIDSHGRSYWERSRHWVHPLGQRAPRNKAKLGKRSKFCRKKSKSLFAAY